MSEWKQNGYVNPNIIFNKQGRKAWMHKWGRSTWVSSSTRPSHHRQHQSIGELVCDTTLLNIDAAINKVVITLLHQIYTYFD